MVDHGAELLSEVPALAESLGPLDFRLRDTDRDVGEPFGVVGQRALATGTGVGGIEELWLDPVRVAGCFRLQSAETRDLLVTPLGVERRLDINGTLVTERLVVGRDAPVCWLEWSPAGSGDPGPIPIELEWRVGLASPVDGEPGAVAWRRAARALLATRGGGAVRAFFVFSRKPEALWVEPAPATAGDGAGVVVRARVTVPGEQGLRLAVIGVGPDDDPGRLLRIADRTRVAVRSREGVANRLLDDGLSVSTPDRAVDRAVAWARVRLDATRLASTPGPWRLEDAAGTALARLPAGDFDTVRELLTFLAGLTDDSGRIPVRGAGSTALAYDEVASSVFVSLVAHYLAWSGDLAGVRGLGNGLVPAALRAGEDPGAHVAWPVSGSAGWEGPGGVIRWLVSSILGAQPDASRGRLVLRPRPPVDWTRLEIRRLAVGSATVDVGYGRSGGTHRLTLEQGRGAVPLQVVLEPELSGARIAAVRVDGEPAELDVVPAGDRWRVPVQIVLDHGRTLEVEFDDDSP